MRRIQFPWKWVVRRMARRRGFLDPFAVLAQVSQFGQPAETLAPTELLRSGMVLHARGMVNSQAFQHNLDWVWPHWVVRQFDPHDEAFVPWAFAISHINLTFRNWTAVGLPDVSDLPIVDPRGLVTPLLDGWSLDAAIVVPPGPNLIPSRQTEAEQRLLLEGRLAVLTRTRLDTLHLDSEVEVFHEPEGPVCRIRWTGRGPDGAWLVVSLRPYNPEGISFVHAVSILPDRLGWKVNGREAVRFSEAPRRHFSSRYGTGDVYDQIPEGVQSDQAECSVGMATAAALFDLEAGAPREVTVTVPLAPSGGERLGPGSVPFPGWNEAVHPCARLQVPDPRIQFLYEAAVRSLILHSPGDVYPGPYTYKRFWFRDAAFIIHAMTCLGLTERAERALDRFPSRQSLSGYFHSQEGEWDSNGQALWVMGRFCRLTGRQPKPSWHTAILRAAKWIRGKRLPAGTDTPHAGLFPPGFSAEHFGPNDYYYWDDLWGVGGLRAAADLLEQAGDSEPAQGFRKEADDFLSCTEESIRQTGLRLRHPVVPASPHRRPDAGAIGPIVASYPLQLWAPDDLRLKATLDFLLRRCFVRGCFFQEINHSGINAYLTMHVTQALLREGDGRHEILLHAVADLASPTGQWPEGIHPRTLGGCMGDGQHVWASAEWAQLIRNLFVREEGEKQLILGSGLPAAWYGREGDRLSFGPSLTPFGEVTVTLERGADRLQVKYEAHWRGAVEPVVELRLPGRPARIFPPGRHSMEVPLS